MAYRYSWHKKQYRCLAVMWGKESAWNEKAHNGSSGAHGIPQAMPGSKMAKFGANWRSNPTTQIKWGLATSGVCTSHPSCLVVLEVAQVVLIDRPTACLTR